MQARPGTCWDLQVLRTTKMELVTLSAAKPEKHREIAVTNGTKPIIKTPKANTRNFFAIILQLQLPRHRCALAALNLSNASRFEWTYAKRLQRVLGFRCSTVAVTFVP
jgi:hypothetical protein